MSLNAEPKGPLNMVSGDIHTFLFAVVDEDGAAVNISGYGIAASIFTVTDGQPVTPALVSYTVGAGVTITTAASGEFSVATAAVDTAGVSGRHYLEIETTDGSTKDRTIGRFWLDIVADLITA